VAVYEGARPRTTLLPRRVPGFTWRARDAGGATLTRRRTRSAVRARRRSSRVGLALGGIVLVFLLALFSLAQTVRVSATGVDVDRLRAEQEQLVDTQRSLLAELNKLGREPAVRRQALDAGLGPLVDPLVLPAR